MLRGSGSVLIILNVRARERAVEGKRGPVGEAAVEVVRETGIHNTPISRSAAALSGVHTAADAPGPGCILGRNYGGSLARSFPLSSLPPPLPSLSPLVRVHTACALRAVLLRLGLVRTCHTTCARQTQRGSYMARGPIFHATRGRADAFCTREPRENERAA